MEKTLIAPRERDSFLFFKSSELFYLFFFYLRVCKIWYLECGSCNKHILGAIQGLISAADYLAPYI